MKQGLRSALILTAVAGLGGCVTYPTSYIASGPGGGVDCRYVRCSYDGYAYLPPSSARFGYAGSSAYVSGPAWYGSSRWYSPYRHGYTAYGFRDPWYDPWGNSFSWSPWYPAWYSITSSGGSWSIGYGSSYSPWGGSYWNRPWSYSSWYGSGAYGYGGYGGGWRSTWHRPYYGHRPPPRERHVDWRPADGIGVADPYRRPAADEVQRIADRSRFGYSDGGSLRDPDNFEVVRGAVEPELILEAADPTRLDQRPGRVMPRGAADGWVAPMPGSQVPVNERWEGNAGAVDGDEPSRFDPPPQRYETSEPERYERPMPERFEAPEAQRYEAPEPQRYEAPEPERYERPMPERFEAPEAQRYQAPEPQRYEAPEPARYERPMPERFEAPEPQRYEAPEPQRYEAPEPQRSEAPEPQRYEAPEPQRYEAPEPQRYEAPEPQRYEAPEPARFEPESDDEPR
jgi:hypothetical protein